MRDRAKDASLSDVCKHLASGAALGVFLALALIVGNDSIFGAIANSAHPRFFVVLLVVCTAASTGVGSAISGFILTSIEKSR
jgi:hypothetical protein